MRVHARVVAGSGDRAYSGLRPRSPAARATARIWPYHGATCWLAKRGRYLSSFEKPFTAVAAMVGLQLLAQDLCVYLCL